MQCNLTCAGCTCPCNGQHGEKCVDCKACNEKDQHGPQQSSDC